MGVPLNKGGIISRKTVTDQYHFTHKIKEIMSTFFISPTDLKVLAAFFNKIDSAKKGFITLPLLYLLIKESPNKSEVSPFLDHLFGIVDKKFHDQITFEEFLPFLISFCISSKYQLIQFVFNLIDTDHNKYISREQIIELFSTKRNNENLFYLNHPKRIKEYQGKGVIRSDKLSIDDFVALCTELPFVYYPAVQLQKKLRKHFINERFWVKFEGRIRKEFIENITKKEDLKLQVNIADIRNKVIDERIKNFKKRWENEQKEKLNKGIYKEEIRLAVPRRNSDTGFFLYKYKETQKVNEVSSARNVDLHITVSIRH